MGAGDSKDKGGAAPKAKGDKAEKAGKVTPVPTTAASNTASRSLSDAKPITPSIGLGSLVAPVKEAPEGSPKVISVVSIAAKAASTSKKTSRSAGRQTMRLAEAAPNVVPNVAGVAVSTWTPEHVVFWLRQHHVEEAITNLMYKNGITGCDLQDLDAEDLTSMGLPAPAAKGLLKAVEPLQSQTTSVTRRLQGSATPAAKQPTTGKQRQPVTESSRPKSTVVTASQSGSNTDSITAFQARADAAVCYWDCQ